MRFNVVVKKFFQSLNPWFQEGGSDSDKRVSLREWASELSRIRRLKAHRRWPRI